MSFPPAYSDKHQADYEYNQAPANFAAAPQQSGPPHYAGAGPIQQQDSSSNVVVVNQPAATPIITVRPIGDHYMTLSVVMTILCVLCGHWHVLLCAIPALVLSTMARDADLRGDMEAARGYARISLGLNIASVVTFVIVVVAFIITIAVFARTRSSEECYYNYC